MGTILKDFLLLHILTNIEKKRIKLDINNGEIHHTSMIHNATEVAEHYETLCELQSINDGLLRDFDDKDNSIRENLNSVADKYYQNYPSLIEMKKHLSSNSSLGINELKEKITEIEFIELNRRDKVLDDPYVHFELNKKFEQEIEYPSGIKKSYIVTGGSRIARGLTLQGLTITCFTRRANKPNLDTMSQMARWCGYRAGYGELVRILTTRQIAEDYHSIYEAEAHMRMQIERLKDDSDPIKDVIWIQNLGQLKISGRLPTKEFRKHLSGFGDFIAENTWTHYPPELSNGDNNSFIDAFYKLYVKIKQELVKPPKGGDSYRVARDVQKHRVNDFLTAYCGNYSSTNVSEMKEALLSAIVVLDKYAKWNVALANPKKKPIKSFTYLGETFNLSKRTPEKNKIRQVYAGFETATKIDLEVGSIRTQPLLLLYLADHELEYPSGSKCYAGAKFPIVMFGIISPVASGQIKSYISGHREDVTVKPWWML